MRVGFAVFVAAHVRSSYLRFDEQRAAWGSSALVPTARVARSAGSVVRRADLRWIRLPLVAIPPGTASSAESVVGKRLLADVGVGEVIVQTRFTVPRLSALAARTGRHRVAVSIAQREVDPIVVIGDRVAIVDAGGATVTDNARAVQVGEKQVTVSIPTTELGALARALGGPVTVAVLGPSG